MLNHALSLQAPHTLLARRGTQAHSASQFSVRYPRIALKQAHDIAINTV
jgi:hypothetical protein